MKEINRRSFIKKSALGIAGITLLVNTISCADDDILIQEENIEIPDKIYITNHIQKKKITNKTYRVNDENRIELLLTGIIMLKTPNLLDKIIKLGFEFEEFNNTHYKIYFNKNIKYPITRNLNNNITIHYILEEENLKSSKNTSSIKLNHKVNSFQN